MSGDVERVWQRRTATPFRPWVYVTFVLASAFWLRWQRFPMRFSQISFAYAAYYEPWQAAVNSDPVQGWLHFVGLHPPLYSASMAVILASGAGLWGAHLFSGVLSSLGVAGVYVAGRFGQLGHSTALVASLLATVLVYLLHYGLELNNYPMLFCLSSWLLAVTLIHQREPSRKTLVAQAALMVLGVYTHILMVPLAGLLLASTLLVLVRQKGLTHALWKSRQMRWWMGVCLVVTVLALPLLRPVLEKAGQGTTFQNEASAVIPMLIECTRTFVRRFGAFPVWAVLGLCVTLGFKELVYTRRQLEILHFLAPYALMLGIILFLASLGIAAAHQYPYYLVAAPGLLLLASVPLNLDRHSSRDTAVRLGFWSVITAQAVAGQLELMDAQRQILHWNQSSAAAQVRQAVLTSDIVWLIAPPKFEDDDKRATDPLYPWLQDGWGCHYWQPADLEFEYVDFRFGQPMQCGSKVYFALTDIYQGPMMKLLMYLLNNGARISIVLYGVEESPDYKYKLNSLLKVISDNNLLLNNISVIMVPSV